MVRTKIYKYQLTASHSQWTLLASRKGICRLLFPGDSIENTHRWLNRFASDYEIIEDRIIFEEFGAIQLLENYFLGQPVSFKEVHMDLWGTPFQSEVWTALGEIPYGEVRTYKQIAEIVGRPKAVRAVGTANGRNPLPIFLPCHRVVGADGTLTGYRGGLHIKNKLLKLEGVTHVEVAGHERFNF